MKPSLPDLSLPPGMDERKALGVVLKYAPALRFHKSEEHFPSDPAAFRRRSRFRKSVAWGRDKSWHKGRRSWVKGDGAGFPYLDVPWVDIGKKSLARFPGNAPFLPPRHGNVRPHDERNVSNGSVDGLYLHRGKKKGETVTGNRPDANDAVRAPLFIDSFYDAPRSMVKVLYWFFYELNWVVGIFTHQGDWEHVALVFEEPAFRAGDRPEWIYFAQHNRGDVRRFDRVKPDDASGCHPRVYVDRHGHPSHPTVRNPWDYPHRWATWEREGRVHWVSRADWRDFAGAWGEVGEFASTTGPLGPYFKRHRDRVCMRMHQGLVCLVTHEP